MSIEYFRIVKKVLADGEFKENRTGIRALTIPNVMYEHDMSTGFPLLTSRRLPYKSTKVELEFFIKGLSDKRWLQERGCKYWDEWCNPKKVPYGNTKDVKEKMKAESDLGLVYGVQWRNYNSQGIDQLKNIVNTLKTNPDDRRMICMAWNPAQISEMALPPCHYDFRVSVINGKLNLAWDQRSVDVACGLPANIASYATLLHLLAKESNLKEGKLVGFLSDVHIYEFHLDNIKIQLARTPSSLPTIETTSFTSIFDWTHDQTNLLDYTPSDKLYFDIAV